jgi:hypothetical protein
MKHEPEHTKKPEDNSFSEMQRVGSLFARVFIGTEDGKAVLAELRKRYRVDVPCFTQPYDPIAAAIKDGERRPMLFIEGAISVGAPRSGINPNP